MTTKHYLWDPVEDNIVRELDAGGATVADYTTEPDHFGNVLSQRRSGQTRFFHYDGVGSTLAVTDAGANITDTRAYGAFGEVTATSGSTTFPFQYVGQMGYHRDDASGQYLIRRRIYQPTLGRFLSQDPLITSEMDQLYCYAGDSPLNRVDPSGLQWMAHIYDVRLSNCKSNAFHVRHDFSILAANLPKPQPKQVWVLNKQTILYLTRNCDFDLMPSTTLNTETWKVVRSTESYVIDAWTLRPENNQGKIWTFEDTFQQPIASASKECLWIVRNEKKIGFNGLRKNGTPYTVEDGMNPIDKRQYDILYNFITGPFGYLVETYVHFHKQNCPPCLSDCMPIWAWDLIPACLNCFVFSGRLHEHDPNTNVITQVGPHICSSLTGSPLAIPLPSSPVE